MMKVIHDCDGLRIVEFDPSDSDETILRFIQRCENHDNINEWWICMSGFNDDPRELIEIPEARQFSRRLIDLGILITLKLPLPPKDGETCFQYDNPGLNGIGLHAISNGAGQVHRRGKRVYINMGVDSVGYFTAVLKTLKERRAPAELIKMTENVIRARSKLDPLSGSAKFATDITLVEQMQSQDEGFPRLG